MPFRTRDSLDKVKAATGVIVDSELESDLSPVLSDIDNLPFSKVILGKTGWCIFLASVLHVIHSVGLCIEET